MENILRSFLRPRKTGDEAKAIGEATKAISFEQSAMAQRKRLTKDFLDRYGRTVQDGPFKGMILPRTSSWENGEELPKALGQYEAELHHLFSQLYMTRYFDTIINIGCAEGFYAVGLALLFSNSEVFAFDADSKAQVICKEAARENNVAERIYVSGFCDKLILKDTIGSKRRCLIVCDCEGYELEIIDPDQIPQLRSATMLIECHDFIDNSITSVLQKRLESSHKLMNIVEGSRNPNLHEFQVSLSSIDRWLTICEFRPQRMNWLFSEPRQS